MACYRIMNRGVWYWFNLKNKTVKLVYVAELWSLRSNNIYTYWFLFEKRAMHIKNTGNSLNHTWFFMLETRVKNHIGPGFFCFVNNYVVRIVHGLWLIVWFNSYKNWGTYNMTNVNTIECTCNKTSFDFNALNDSKVTVISII